MWCMGSVVAALGFSCSEACGILVLTRDGTHVPAALQGRFLTTGPPGKSLWAAFELKEKRQCNSGFLAIGIIFIEIYKLVECYKAPCMWYSHNCMCLQDHVISVSTMCGLIVTLKNSHDVPFLLCVFLFLSIVT